MKKSLALILFTSGVFLVGCESNTGTGGIVGGAVGMGIGGIVGGGEGALIGGATGAIVGGLIGATLDEREKRELKAQSANTYNRIDNEEQLTVQDIINMHKASISEDKQIELIQKTKSHFVLNSYQIEQMHNAGVSNRVIDYMMHQT